MAVSAITFLYLAVTSAVVLLKNPRKPLHVSLAAALLMSGTWLVGVAGLTTTLGENVVFGRLIYVAAILGMVSVYLFVYFFAESTKTSLRWSLQPLPALLIAGGLSLCAVSPLLLRRVEAAGTGELPDPVFGPAYALFAFWLGYMALSIAALLVKTYRCSKGGERGQAKVILIGFCLFVATAITTNVLLPLVLHNHQAAKLTPLSTIILAFALSYAILKYRFLDLRLIVARSLAYFLLLSTLVGMYALVVLGLTRQVFGSDSTVARDVAPIVAAILLAFTEPFLKRFFDRATNRVFYRDAYDTQAFLDELNAALVGKVRLRVLMRQASEVIAKHVRPEYCLLSVRRTGFDDLRIHWGDLPKLSEADTELVHHALLKLGRKQTVTDDLDGDPAGPLRDILARSGVGVINRLAVSQDRASHATAYLVLGRKKSGNHYSRQDLRIIDIVADQLMIAMQNALRFEEIENFNLTLQEKVTQATKELRQSNDKLLVLDATKDDFISMASHQLRTPLTSIKGYLSLVLEGDAGIVPPAQQKLLQQAFFSSQRMVYLIADLLNVSRLGTGKFTIDKAPLNLLWLVEEEVAQLEEIALNRELTLSFEAPPGDFPELPLDETKTRQVVMNFIDNALYYTPAGGHVRVRLLDEPEHVELRVSDDGIGVPRRDQPHLFTKFYRAGNARQARPDGTGLGLFMAKKVIDAQGGTVVFDSQEGEGSTFGFRFRKGETKAKAGTAKKKFTAY